jgi:hypothetical protein
VTTSRVTLVHLSDIHLRAENRLILNRIDALDAAIRSETGSGEVLVVVVSGDLAFSGSPEEYVLVETLLTSLTQRLRSWAKSVDVVLVPGNHDCDFRTESRLRPLVLSEIDELLDEIDSDKHDAAAQCLCVQQHFFEFAAPYLASILGDRLHYRAVYKIGPQLTLRFECLNTAWLSRKQEEQGQIRLPHKIASRIRDNGSTTADDFVITVFHHPYGWFDSTNRRQIQAELEKNSDLIITGHEHVPDQYHRITPETSHVQYIEGGVLQGDGPGSSFNIVRLDCDLNEQNFIRFEFRANAYTPERRTGPLPLAKNTGAFGRRLLTNDIFNSELNDPGRSFKHPRRRDLRLRDLFIYPDLGQRLFEKRARGQKSGPTAVYSENVLQHLLDVKRSLIIGPNESGKTALARAIYSDLQLIHHLVPVMITGRDLEGYTAESFRRTLAKIVPKQYSTAIADEYFQLPPEKKVLIIDVFESFEYNSKGQARILGEAEKHFGTIIVLANDLFRYEELSDEAREANPFVSYDHCEIRPLGFRLRRQLIRKWVLLGREYRFTAAQVFEEVERREDVIDNILRGELIPAYPLLVLLILQADEVDPNQAVTSGTYGYLNDFLITRALANISRHITDIGTMSTYLSHLAYAEFVFDKEELSRAEFDEITSRYLDEYGLTLKADALLRDLTTAQILVETNGQVEFRHRHYYYYFVARFFRDNIDGKKPSESKRKLTNQLREIADNIYFDPYVSILTFYLYFKKDEDLIEYLLQSSKQIYSEYEPCNLDSHVEFLNKLYEKKPKRSLVEPRPEERRDQILREMDEEASQAVSYQAKPSKLKYSQELQDYLKINIALKTLQVLGQVLKDSPGQLPAKLKADLAEECYSLGLRTLRAVLMMSEVNLAKFQEAIEELLKERRAIDPAAKVPKGANEFLIWLSLGAALGVIRRISRAVGHSQLEKTYNEVLRRFGGMVSAELIDLAIKLDHFHSIRDSLIEDLVQDRLRNNIFGYQIVQNMVYNYFSLFPSERKQRQRICGMVGIMSEDPRFLESRLKRLPPAGGPPKNSATERG